MDRLRSSLDEIQMNQQADAWTVRERLSSADAMSTERKVARLGYFRQCPALLHKSKSRARRTNDRDYLNPYLNFHRPCFFAEVVVDAKGKQRKRYPYERMMTPYEKLESLPKTEGFLKPDVTVEHLNALAMQLSIFSGRAGTIIACGTTGAEQHRSMQFLNRRRGTYEQLSDEPA